MTLDDQLIKKTYYELFINVHEEIHPIRVLGDLFQEEQRKDIPDSSYIRFAQGEVYFHNKDYEAAIFKWGTIANELEPWAKKNIADAYYEQGELPTAEAIYKGISSDNLTLTTEVELKLFSLYIDQGKSGEAVVMIKRTVESNPDYPHVTELARAYFEQHLDWENAIELAVNEAIRKEAIEWFDILKTYVDKNVTKRMDPAYFSNALTLLFQLDPDRFESLVSAFWKSYKVENCYFAWLEEVNQLLANLELQHDTSWHELSEVFKETYFSLMDGTHLINQLQNYIPNLLVNWVKITDSKQAIYASTAALSWSELFPASIPMSTITEAEKLFSKTAKNVDEFEECLSLFDSILLWAKGHDMGENLRMKWIEDQLIGYDTTYLFMAGLSGSGKSSFVNFVLGEKIMDQAPTSSVVLFKNADKMEISEITDEEVIGLSSITDFQERMERRRNALDSIIEFKQPNLFLKENKLAFIDSPGLTVNPHESSDVLKYLSIADACLFVLEATAPFTDKDRTVLSYLQTEAPGTQVHFLLNKMDLLKNEEEAIRVYDKTKGIIQSYLPEAKIFAFSSNYERIGQQNDLGEFIKSLNIVKNIQDKRMGKLLSFIRSTITMFLKKRIDVENGLIESVRWNEDIVQKFNGALNQLSDLEGQKSKVITRSYHSIKESMQKEISVSIPKLLRECAQFIKEDSNFSQIHFELNAEMNKRLQEYLDNTVMTRFLQSLEEWINQAKNEFDEGQSFLNEMADGFNVLYGEERMILECDFKVLDDWRRDKDRMTSRFQLEPINILLRRTPSQLLLKSAGKLFEALSQNKAMLFNKYKQFVETEDYSEAAAIVAKQFFQQFELFEKSLERDVTMFFKNPGNELKKAAVEASAEINANQETLKKLNTNPELYRDPLTLFEVKLRQFEWMTVSGKNVHHTV